jgi:Fe-S cluster biosynthesis and repair protein YggX
LRIRIVDIKIITKPIYDRAKKHGGRLIYEDRLAVFTIEERATMYKYRQKVLYEPNIDKYYVKYAYDKEIGEK